jgi:hypothetical protein
MANGDEAPETGTVGTVAHAIRRPESGWPHRQTDLRRTTEGPVNPIINRCATSRFEMTLGTVWSEFDASRTCATHRPPMRRRFDRRV